MPNDRRGDRTITVTMNRAIGSTPHPRSPTGASRGCQTIDQVVQEAEAKVCELDLLSPFLNL